MSITITILSIYTILTLWILRFIVVFRHRISHMVGMMAAMAQGMTIGLGAGTLLVIWLPGEIFHATIFGMLIGGMIGAISGIPIGMIATLDGLLSGIMAGMMGPMFMVMVPTAYAESALKIIAVLCSGALFLLLLMLQSEVKAEHSQKRSVLLSKPGSMFAVIALFAFMLYFADMPKMTFDKSHNNAADPNVTHQHNSEKNLTNHNDKELVIKATEFSFSPSAITLNANEKVKITLENTGTMEHEFEIIGTDIHVHASPGQTSSTIATLEQAGEYEAVCTLPGHQEAGMITIINVNAS